MDIQLRKKIVNCFKLHGFALKPDAVSYLVGIFQPIEVQQHNLWFDRLIDKIQQRNLTSNLLQKELFASVVKELGKGETQTLSDFLHFISAYDVPILDYYIEGKNFSLRNCEPEILGNAEQKVNQYRHRYDVLHQRTLHHELFTKQAQGNGAEQEQTTYTLRAIEFLLGSNAKLGNLVVLGMITELKEGKYYLEDTTGSVELDMTETKFHTGLYSESCFVLAEGVYEYGVFNVKTMGMPPPETAKITRLYHPATNFFGAPITTATKARLEFIEKQNEDSNILIISDVYIDKYMVLNQLKMLFSGYAESPPLMVVLMGNFLSENYGSKSSMKLKTAFKELGELIANYPRILSKSIFVIIPGPTDPGFINVLPRPAFSDFITSHLNEILPNCVFGTNPFRIKYCSKEIVLFREDILTKMCRNCVYFPTDGDIPTHFVKTLVGQNNLCPLPKHVCPTYWTYDQALSLYPLPDLVVVADKFDPFSVTLLDCIFVNPGNFVKSDYSFQVYIPSLSKLEDCQLPAYVEPDILET